MAETSSAATLASQATGVPVSELEAPATESETEVVEIEEVEVIDPEEVDEESEEQEEEPEELPDNIKDILKKNRKELREAKAKIAALEAKDSDSEAEPAAPSEADLKYKSLYLNTTAKNALVNAGFTTGTEKFLKMLDMDSIDVDENGEISGLDEQIKEIAEDFKEILVKKTPRKTVSSDAAGRRVTPPAPKTSAEVLAEALYVK